MSTFQPLLPALFLGFYECNRERPNRNRRGKVFRTQGTIATASLCHSGGEDGVRGKKSAWGTTEREKGRSRPLPIIPREISFYFEFSFANRPFYRYGGRVELIRFKEYYRMPWGHEHISFVFLSAFRNILS